MTKRWARRWRGSPPRIPSGRRPPGRATLPEIKTTAANGLAVLVPPGALSFTTAECSDPADLCALARPRQLEAVVAKFDGDP